ncbi:MAG: DUF58 domain-containing protein [Pirellulaceae bacterium]|nr:DUF58 domain-containing protein [Planctomycetales bacterium]
MIPRELMARIRRIQIRTSHLADDMLIGQYHSAFKGRGIEFEEVRPYQIGDDVRSIDWNVTARMGEPYVKLFREERELTVMLLVDLSASQSFGTHYQTKREAVTELAATLAFSAIKNNDKIGLLLFTDEIEKAVPARKGSRHVLRVIRELLYCEPIGRGTNIGAALQYLNSTVKRRAIVFLISDFLDSRFEQPLRVAKRRHDLVPIVVSDRREHDLPNVGFLNLRDAETGHTVLLDTSSARQRTAFADRAAALCDRRQRLFRTLQLDSISIETGEDFVEPLRKFFHRREERQ